MKRFFVVHTHTSYAKLYQTLLLQLPFYNIYSFYIITVVNIEKYVKIKKYNVHFVQSFQTLLKFRKRLL